MNGQSLSEFGWLIFGIAILSLLTLFVPKLAGPFTLLLLTVLALNIHKRGLL